MKKIAILLALTMSLSVFSNQTEENNINMGIGVFYRKSLYKEKDKNETLPVPFAGIHYKNFYFEAPIELGYSFYENEDLKLTAYGRYNLYTGYKPKDLIKEFRDMDRRKDDIHVGIKEKYSFGPFRTRIDSNVSGDVSGRSKGILARVELNQPVPITEKIGVQPYIAVEYMSSNYTDYYFGITDKEASRGINNWKKYEADDSFNFEAGIRSKIDINESFTVLLSAEYTRYGNGVADSPLVDDRNIYTIGAGISYTIKY